MATPLGSSVPVSGNTLVDGLTQGSKWSSGNLTYSLWDSPYGEWNSVSKELIDLALQQIENVTNIHFTYVETYGEPNLSTDLEFIQTGDLLDSYPYEVYGQAIFPDTAFGNALLDEIGVDRTQWPSPEGLVMFDNYDYVFYGAASLPGGQGFTTIIHEIGHALGLKHPHDSGGNYTRSSFEQLGISGYDNQLYTMMSYNGVSNATNFSYNIATPMPLDILALQYLYGANTSHNAGDSAYALTDDGIVVTLWDAGGTDRVDGSALSVDVILDMRPGEWSLIGSTYGAVAYNTIIEHATTGAGDDLIFGNITNNTITANGGSDFIKGFEGNDYLYGNVGQDIIYGNQGADFLYGGKDNDSLYGGQDADFMLGNFADDQMFGNFGNDYLHAGAGNDYLHGGSGNDTLNGGVGNDTLVGGVDADVFTFAAGGSADIIADFGNGADVVQLIGFGITTFEAVSGLIGASGNGVVINFTTGDSLSLSNINTSDLGGGDFVFA